MAKERRDAGKCYVCEESVYVSEGQALKYKRIRMGNSFVDYPVHKICRKGKKKV